MRPNTHTGFILSPITDILKDVVSASVGIGSGIETYPLCDYIMQSVFLKMTGFQEQKMKCICWELATVDYEYRYDFTKTSLGECSSYSDKQKIYKELVKQIEKYGLEFSKINIDKKNIRKTTLSDILNIFSNTNLSIWAQAGFNELKSNTTLIKPEDFMIISKENTNNLFQNVLQDKYKALYNQRNKIAHNTPSYQQNLPTLKTLASDDYKYENYFVYFVILVLIDKIFIELYKKYLETIEDREN